MNRQKFRQQVSLFLVVLLAAYSPAVAYASPETPSNTRDWSEMGEDYTEDVPFYYDEDMRKVYDYETFPERYYGMSPAIAGVDDVALLAIVAVGCVLGAFGIHMASEDIGTFLVGSFKPWLEKRHPDKMSDFEIFLTGGAIAVSEWVPLFGEFLNGEEVTVKDTGIEYKPASVPAKPYFSDRVIEGQTFLRTYVEANTSSSYTTIRDYYFDSSLDIFCLYVNSSATDPERYNLSVYFRSGDSYQAGYFTYYYNRLKNDGYFEYSRSQKATDSRMLILASDVNSISDYPVFINGDAARSYMVYGTTGGMINNQALSIIKTGASLLKDNLKFHQDYAYADSITLPSDEAGLKSIVSSLDTAKTYEEVMEVVDKYWQTSKKKVELSDADCYSNLQYVIRVLSRYAGTAITDEQIDSFISHFYQTNTDGTSALAEKQAGEIVRQFVVINGGNQEPDDDKNKNKYVIVKRLATGLGLFLVSIGLVSDAPVFEGGQTIENVSLVGSPTELPDPDPDKPSSPTVDLSGILDFLKQILEILKAWASPSSLMDLLKEKLSLNVLFGSIVTAINELPSLLSGELALPALLSDLAATILSPLNGLTEPIGNILLAINSVFEKIPSPSEVAQAVSDVVIGEDDGNYRLDSVISDKFPFCIPFDLIDSFRVLLADPIEPVFEIPLIIDHGDFSFKDSIEIDLTKFDNLLPMIQFFVLLFYVTGLILATRSLIKG
ncbi:MAG: hypothetical protein HFG53_15860 [Lachnospiraceae bacterium]|jgi:hypothetical protein|nr:hypothetical protein [Lachnospiraceae bacterium]